MRQAWRARAYVIKQADRCAQLSHLCALSAAMHARMRASAMPSSAARCCVTCCEVRCCVAIQCAQVFGMRDVFVCVYVCMHVRVVCAGACD